MRYFPNVYLCDFCKQREKDRNIISDDIYETESALNEDLKSFGEKESSFILDEAEECESSSDQATEAEEEENEFYFS
jgi:hypothetical protein